MVTYNTVCPPDFVSILTDTVVSGGVPVTQYRFADPRLGGYAVTVVLDTVQPGSVVRMNGDNPGRIVTMVGRFPRCVLSEFNTHRVFSRNSASSRARSVKSVLAGVLEEPYVPVFTENKPGMSGDFITDTRKVRMLTEGWFAARDAAVDAFLRLLLGEKFDDSLDPMGNMGVYYRDIYQQDGGVSLHKQDVNRLLEPFMWHEVVFTSVFWDNFLKLRCDAASTYVPFYAFAVLVKHALEDSTPIVGDYHVPFLPAHEREELTGNMGEDQDVLLKASAAAASVSYRDMGDTEANLALGRRLLALGHMSPFEHVAYAAKETPSGVGGNFGRDWVQFRRFLEENTQ